MKENKVKSVLKRLVKDTTCATCGLKQFENEISQARKKLDKAYYEKVINRVIPSFRPENVVAFYLKDLKAIFNQEK